MRPKEIKLADVEYIAFRLAKRFLEWNEPIPSFGSRFPNRLESCLATPFQKFGKKYLYKGLIRKGAVLFYLMNKNHPFQNGNKRIAMTTLLVFLQDNAKWLTVPQKKLYEFAKEIAASNPQEKDVVIDRIETFIRGHLKSL